MCSIKATQVRSVQEEELANEVIGLRSGGDIMGHMHFLFLSLFSPLFPTSLLTLTITYIHIPRDTRISHSRLPLFAVPHLYSLAWQPPIPQLYHSFC